MLPKGWNMRSFGELATFRNGINFARGEKGQVLKILGVGDFQSRSVLNSTEFLKSVVVDKILPDDMLSENDLVFVRSNGNKALIGRCLIIRVPSDQPVTFTGFSIRARLFSDDIIPQFASHLFHSPLFKRMLNSEGGGSSISNLSQDILANFNFPLPPKIEQRRIAGVLDAWSNTIAVAERLVEAKRVRFDWLREKVLTGQKRLHGFNDVWRTVRLVDIVSEHGLSATGAEEVFSVSVHKGLVNQIEHLGRSFSANDTGHYNRVLPGDIVYTKSPTGEFPLGIIKQSKIEKDVIVSPLYGVFTPATRELGIILDAYFTSPKATEKYLTPLVQKGAKNTIAVTNSQFLQGVISMPRDGREIQALAQFVASAVAEIAAAEAELERFRQQKRGLMQRLLTGKLRTPESIDALLPPADELVVAA